MSALSHTFSMNYIIAALVRLSSVAFKISPNKNTDCKVLHVR